MAKLGHLQAEDTENILDDFYKNCLTQKVVTDGGVEYARAVLEKAYGEDMADELLRKMSRFLKNRTFDFLSKVDTKNLFNILQNERAQTIAIVLSHMESDKAADLLAELPDKKRIQVVRNIAKMDGRLAGSDQDRGSADPQSSRQYPDLRQRKDRRYRLCG